MKYVQINAVRHGSTGNVMERIHAENAANDIESWMLWGRGQKTVSDHEANFGSDFGGKVHALLTLIDGKGAFHSRFSTARLIEILESIDPDVVHLHNLHGNYVHVGMLFDWLSKQNVKVYWTLHDCWAFTGHCPHFTRVKCEEWKTGCDPKGGCPLLMEHAKTLNKRSSAANWRRKRDTFCKLDDLTIITPSEWLAGLVGQSFLQRYPVVVKKNDIDRSVFRRVANSFKADHGISGKFMVLGVASPWSNRKGLDSFVRFSKDLGEEFAIVLIGLSQRQIEELPESIVRLGRTSSKEDLAAAYSAADVFFNPSLEDNYPTVNLEAEACETDVVTFDTGGCRETITREGSVVVSGYEEALREIISKSGATVGRI